MLIKYNRAWLIDLKKLAKPGNLSGFPFGTIRRNRELKIQNGIQQWKKNQPKQPQQTTWHRCKESKADPNPQPNKQTAKT